MGRQWGPHQYFLGPPLLDILLIRLLEGDTRYGDERASVTPFTSSTPTTGTFDLDSCMYTSYRRSCHAIWVH